MRKNGCFDMKSALKFCSAALKFCRLFQHSFHKPFHFIPCFCLQKCLLLLLFMLRVKISQTHSFLFVVKPVNPIKTQKSFYGMAQYYFRIERWLSMVAAAVVVVERGKNMCFLATQTPVVQLANFGLTPAASPAVSTCGSALFVK